MGAAAGTNGAQPLRGRPEGAAGFPPAAGHCAGVPRALSAGDLAQRSRIHPGRKHLVGRRWQLRSGGCPSAPPLPPSRDQTVKRGPGPRALRGPPRPPAASCCARSPSHALGPRPYYPAHPTLPGSGRASRHAREARGSAWGERPPLCPPDPAQSPPARQFPQPPPRPTWRRRRPKPQQGPRDRFTPCSFTAEFHGCLRNSFLRLWGPIYKAEVAAHAEAQGKPWWPDCALGQRQHPQAS